jgi:hypothetical protein
MWKMSVTGSHLLASSIPRRGPPLTWCTTRHRGALRWWFKTTDATGHRTSPRLPPPSPRWACRAAADLTPPTSARHSPPPLFPCRSSPSIVSPSSLSVIGASARETISSFSSLRWVGHRHHRSFAVVFARPPPLTPPFPTGHSSPAVLIIDESSPGPSRERQPELRRHHIWLPSSRACCLLHFSSATDRSLALCPAPSTSCLCSEPVSPVVSSPYSSHRRDAASDLPPSELIWPRCSATVPLGANTPLPARAPHKNAADIPASAVGCQAAKGYAEWSWVVCVAPVTMR